MKNIEQARKDIKKKLSFNDYTAPVHQHTSMPATEQKAEQALVHQQASMPSNQYTVKSVSQYASTPTYQHTGNIPHNVITTNKPANQQAGNSLENVAATSTPVNQQTGMTLSQHAGIPVCQPKQEKVKATYYLDSEVNKALTEIYINRLQANSKTDKSALICEAIQLLYKKESLK